MLAIFWLKQSAACRRKSTWPCDRLSELYLYRLHDVASAMEWTRESLRREPTGLAARMLAAMHRDFLDDQVAADEIQQEAIRCDFPWYPALPPGSRPLSGEIAIAAASGSGLAPPGLVLARNAQQRPCFTAAYPSERPRVFAITIPKSGTYLLAALLDELGLVGSGTHLATDTFDDQRGVPFCMTRNYPELLTQPLPLSFTAGLVQEGQYAYGHIECTAANEAALTGFRKLFVYRNLRDGVVSLLRHHRKIKMGSPLREVLAGARSDPERLHRLLDAIGFIESQTYQRIAAWIEREDVPAFSYEILVGDSGPEPQLAAVAKIAELAGARCTTAELQAALQKSLGKETCTSSGKRSSWRDCWDDTIETLFRTTGFYQLNQKLGYEK